MVDAAKLYERPNYTRIEVGAKRNPTLFAILVADLIEFMQDGRHLFTV